MGCCIVDDGVGLIIAWSATDSSLLNSGFKFLISFRYKAPRSTPSYLPQTRRSAGSFACSERDPSLNRFPILHAPSKWRQTCHVEVPHLWWNEGG